MCNVHWLHACARGDACNDMLGSDTAATIWFTGVWASSVTASQSLEKWESVGSFPATTSSCTARLSNLVQSCATLLFVKIPLLDAIESLAVGSLPLSFRPLLVISSRHQFQECNYCILEGILLQSLLHTIAYYCATSSDIRCWAGGYSRTQGWS